MFGVKGTRLPTLTPCGIFPSWASAESADYPQIADEHVTSEWSEIKCSANELTRVSKALSDDGYVSIIPSCCGPLPDFVLEKDPNSH